MTAPELSRRVPVSAPEAWELCAAKWLEKSKTKVSCSSTTKKLLHRNTETPLLRMREIVRNSRRNFARRCLRFQRQFTVEESDSEGNEWRAFCGLKGVTGPPSRSPCRKDLIHTFA